MVELEKHHRTHNVVRFDKHSNEGEGMAGASQGNNCPHQEQGGNSQSAPGEEFDKWQHKVNLEVD